MIQSMTGFGKSSIQLENKKIAVEIRSLNSKNMDLNVRIPSKYRENELGVRKMITDQLIRGKVDVFIFTESTNTEETKQQINKEVVQAYMSQLKELVPDKKDEDLLAISMSLPEVLTYKTEELDTEEWGSISETINLAVAQLTNYRTDEGGTLEKEFRLRIENIQKLQKEVDKYEDLRVSTIKERIHKKLEDLQAEIDHNRLEQEMIYYIEKLDISEEKQRLTTHCDYFIAELNEKDSSGKKLNFIGQEIGREINTLGSKANHSEMQKIVIQMKDELEKIKEQILNVL